MEKDKVLRVFKKVLFWGGYALLMFLNGVVLWDLIPDVYFSFVDVPYWLENYTHIRKVDENYTPPIFAYIWRIFILIGIFVGVFYGSFLIFKKKKKIKGFLFLSFLIYILILMHFWGEEIVLFMWTR